MLLILQMINDNHGKVDKVDFAKRLYNWMQYGFKELGDYGKCLISQEVLMLHKDLLHAVCWILGGMGIGMTVHRTLTHPSFLTDPHASAAEVWERSG